MFQATSMLDKSALLTLLGVSLAVYITAAAGKKLFPLYFYFILGIYLRNIQVFLMVLIWLFPSDRSYRQCIVSEKKICKEPSTGQGNGFSEEQCKVMCDGSKNCNFLFWNTGWFCALYTTCDELKTSEEVGTIFAKQGNACPGKNDTYRILHI